MLSIYDYLAIVLYFGLIFSAGFMLRRQSKNTSDYFRAGGGIPWWITGAALFMSFSAWTFTGAAGETFKTGTWTLALYWCNVIGFTVAFFASARRLRRLRVITWMEAVDDRFGRATQQFYTWVNIPLLWVMGGVSLFAVAVFMSSVFHVNLQATLITCGVLVTLISFFGGAWAVAANDFIQMFLVMSIAIVAAFLALQQPAVGGVGGLIHRVPPAYFDWTKHTPANILLLWFVAMALINILSCNCIQYAPKFLMVRSDREARKMLILPIFGMLIGSVIWIIPSLTAILTHPHLHHEFPNLRHPSEAAYVAVCLATMPRGMIGLLVSAIFAATITSLDAVLNQGVGVVVRNFYLPIMNPQASETNLLKVSKLCTLAFGAILITIGLLISRGNMMGLFNLSNQIGASLALPLMVPLCLGLFFMRTPKWSGWSTAVVALVASGLVQLFFPRITRLIWGTGYTHFTTVEQTDALLFITSFSVLIFGVIWFFLTSFFYRTTPLEHRRRIDALSERLHTPVLEDTSGIIHNRPFYKVLGILGVIYGIAILCLMLIPNPAAGRIGFLFCGVVMLTVGIIMLKKAK